MWTAVPRHRVLLGARNMSGAVTYAYAAAVSTPSGTIRQPKIQSRACSDPDLRGEFESEGGKKNGKQRPGVGKRSKTSFRGWPAKKTTYKSNPPQEYFGNEKKDGYFVREEHRPQTEGAEEHVYVLTLRLTEDLAAPMKSLREAYFPKALNRTPAHLTLFHALPHSQMQALDDTLTQVCSTTRSFDVSPGSPFRMRRGVGINVDAGYKKMKDVHRDLRTQWLPFLSEQDAGGFRPHWTVMNKVDEEDTIEDALEDVRKEVQSQQRGEANGLVLWRYDKGNWIFSKEYLFRDVGSGLPGQQSQERPGLWKRGSSVGEAWRSLSFRRKS